MKSQAPFNPESLFHISLATDGKTFPVSIERGSSDLPGSQVEPALPRTHPLNAPTSASESDAFDSALLRVIDDVACCANRMRAVECLVNHVSMIFPNTSIRCAMGTKRIKRFYDQRLGWLGAQSSLRIQADARWEILCGQDTVSEETESLEPVSVESEVLISIPQPDGDGRCVIWVEGEGADPRRIDEFDAILPVLRNVFWRRPWISTPQGLSQLGARAKFYLAMMFAIGSLIAIWPTHYPVDCSAKVEPINHRLVCAPFEATLLESKVRPGDSVRQGDALAILDGRPLRLELESIESEMMQAAKEHDVALATGQIADAQQFSLRRERLARKLDLIQDRLQRLTVVSPIDGVVVSGDLDRFIGASLELGQTIIEVAPLDRMAIEIEIPEHDIGFVQPESMTRVRLNSVGGPSIRQPLTDLYPAAEIRDDRNVFVGRILIENTDLNLRPGVRGNATVYGPLRPLAWSWVRSGWERMLWWLGY